jgi:hypothetical protein
LKISLDFGIIPRFTMRVRAKAIMKIYFLGGYGYGIYAA